MKRFLVRLAGGCLAIGFLLNICGCATVRTEQSVNQKTIEANVKTLQTAPKAPNKPKPKPKPKPVTPATPVAPQTENTENTETTPETPTPTPKPVERGPIPEPSEAQKSVLARGSVSPVEVARRCADIGVAGDSIIEAATEYGYLDRAHVFATIGASVYGAGKDFAALKAAAPQTAYLCYGLNDMESYLANVDKFIGNYKAKVNDLKAALPNTDICILSVSPVTDKALARIPAYQYIDTYNAALQKMAAQLGVRYLDTGFLLVQRPDLFDQDGIHPKGDYYGLLFTYLADMAGVAK